MRYDVALFAIYTYTDHSPRISDHKCQKMQVYLVLLEMVNMEREVSKKPNTESTCQSLD